MEISKLAIGPREKTDPIEKIRRKGIVSVWELSVNEEDNEDQH